MFYALYITQQVIFVKTKAEDVNRKEIGKRSFLVARTFQAGGWSRG